MSDTKVQNDPFQTYSGLPDDFDGTITEPYFGYDTDYMGGDKLALLFTLVSPDLEAPEKMLFGTGKDWEPDKTPRGAKIERKGKQAFHENSGCGLLLDAMKEAGAIDAMRKSGSLPMEAAMYDGLSFHWARKTFTYDLDDGKKVTSRLLPVKFLGVETSSNGKGKSKAAGASRTTASKPKPEAPVDDDDDDAGAELDADTLIASLTAKQRAKLNVKAEAADSLEEFVAEAEKAGIVDSDVLLTIAPTLYAAAQESD